MEFNLGYLNTSTFNLKSCKLLTDEDLNKDLIVFRDDGVIFYGKLRKSYDNNYELVVRNYRWSINKNLFFDYDHNKLGEKIQETYGKI